MNAKYDFGEGKRGAVLPAPGKKVRITIRLDRDIVGWFRSKVEEQGGGNCRRLNQDTQYVVAVRKVERIHRTGTDVGISAILGGPKFVRVPEHILLFRITDIHISE